MYTDKKEAMKKLKKGSIFYLKECSEELRNDKDIVSGSIKRMVHNIEYMGETLQKDTEFIKKLIKSNVVVLHYLRDELKKNDEMIEELIRDKVGILIAYCSDAIKDNKELMLIAVTTMSFNYKYISDRLKEDHDIIVARIQKYGTSIGGSPDKYKKDKNYAKMAIMSDGESYKYIDQSLKKDRELIFLALDEGYKEIFKEIPAEYINDTELVIKILQKLKENGCFNEIYSQILVEHNDYRQLGLDVLMNNKLYSEAYTREYGNTIPLRERIKTDSDIMNQMVVFLEAYYMKSLLDESNKNMKKRELKF